MSYLIYQLIDLIRLIDSKHAGKLLEHVNGQDDTFLERSEYFLQKYASYLHRNNLTFSFSVDAYFHLRKSMLKERILFLRTGTYSNSSFNQVYRSVYGNPEVMANHIHGLALAQFLWVDQYERYRFFCEIFESRRLAISRYLEIGGGHALYASHADSVLPANSEIDLIDISSTSISLAKGIASTSRIRFIYDDIRNMESNANYDFITMGEVLEHVEDPLALLKQVGRLLSPGGHAFITTPANAPMIDHIYLFRNEVEIRNMLEAADFQILADHVAFADNMPRESAEAIKAPLMYAALVQHKSA